jgi:23S rRNA pseudouridine2605 synthase/23S rRNA pseudouridine2604 synthase
MTMPEMRIQKYIAHAGICSRRKAEQHILDGQVEINGQVIQTLGIKINPDKDRVRIFGKLVSLSSQLIYIALNKPRGIVTSCKHLGEKVVTDLVKTSHRLYPVGRLDKDSSGLLLLTNDGNLHHKISHPSFNHEKEYLVTVHRKISDHDLLKMADGIVLDHKKTRSASVRRLNASTFQITLKEGRNRQIRRMLEQLNHQVTQLHRIRIDHIQINNLKSGKWRYLSKKEIKLFDEMLCG